MYARVNYYKTIDEFNSSCFNKDKQYLIFISSKCNFTIDDFNRNLRNFVGGIFETIIYKNKVFDDGLMIFELNDEIEIFFVENMDNYLIEQDVFKYSKSIVTVLDGFSKYTSTFLENIFEDVPLDTNVIGGGAGVYLEQEKEVVFNSEGFFKDAAFFILLDVELKIGIGQGWDVLEGPFIASDVDGKFLKQIDYKEAYEVYKEVVTKDCKKCFSEEKEYNLLKRYPLGIVKLDGNYIVRDVVDVKKDGTLVLGGDILPNSVVNILKGERKKLIDDSCKAGVDAANNNSEILMIFECVSRTDCIEEDIKKEIETIIDNSSAKYIFGVISVGEIANDGNKYIYFLNKSCVVGGICH